MDLSFALQFFAAMLTLICVVLSVVVVRLDPTPMPMIVRVHGGGMRRSKWPARLTRAGLVCVLASFAVLIGCCYLLLTM
jgi:hypothetical protein